MILRNLERQPVRSVTSVVGIAFAVAVLLVGLAFIDVMDVLIEPAVRPGDAPGRDGDVRRAAVGARRARGRASAGRDGRRADAQRAGPAARGPALRARWRSPGLPETPQLNRVVDREGRRAVAAADGLVLSRMLGDILDVAPGDRCRSRCSKARGRSGTSRVAALVDDSLGLQAYMRIDAVARCSCGKATSSPARPDARSGGARPLLPRGEADAGGGRRGADAS